MNQEKKTYTKTEVLQELAVQPYILALWEKKTVIQPVDTGKELLYFSNDVIKLLSVKELLYEKGYNLEAAIKYLQDGPPSVDLTPPLTPPVFELKKKEQQTELQKTFSQNLLILQKKLIALRDLL
ncbi:MerR family transcriptional regulator [Candidatus Dependentiae bacterium]|nr:MerR family transcriptional regulator [Candidatus Dependentiae bacterium]